MVGSGYRADRPPPTASHRAIGRSGKGYRRQCPRNCKEKPMAAYSLPELPYDYSALEPHYSAEVLELHHGKHHKAYVDGANTTLEKLEKARDDDDFGAINQLQKNLAFHLSGHVLHSMFWE